TYMFLVLILVGFCIRPECAGVTSFIRAVCLDPGLYKGFLHFFNYSTALDLAFLTRQWHRLAHRMFPVLHVGGYDVYVADGVKIAKEGKKMPGVKKLHQSSENNSKASYIMGHSFQALAVLVRTAAGHAAAVPLTSRIHEGLVWFPGDRRSLLDKLAAMFLETVSPMARPALLVADAYYASGKVIRPLLKEGHQLLTRVRKNGVAYREAAQPKTVRRGRPKKYGKKVQLRKYFDRRETFTPSLSPVYGESETTISYQTEDLLWRPIGRLVRFVWVIHPVRGNVILMCTDCSIDPLTMIQTYGYRFKIEVGFRSAIHGIGTYAYHFWMKAMKPIRRREGKQYLHKKSDSYRKAVKRKVEAYHRFVQLGCIAQGLLQYLSFVHGKEVWRQFRSWLRTMKTDNPPSELVVSYALRSSLFEFLADSPPDHELKKIITENMTVQQMQEYQMTA
ncbi:MAG: transposase, partial [Candidatus Hinthialibacter sp.]